MPILSSALNVFGLFFTDEICEYIVAQTNLYAEQVLGEKYSEWEKVTVEELRAYFGFMVLMGVVSLPAMDDYWRRDPLLHYSPIADRISRDRFRDIHRFLHLADNSSLPERDDPQYTIAWAKSDRSWRSCRRDSQRCTSHTVKIDEAMITFQGRSTLMQCLPNL